MATDAVKSRKVKVGDKNVKPSHLIRKGDFIVVQKNGFNLEFEVVELINKRVSATLAEPCYNNLTPAEELNKYKDWYVGKGAPERREKGAGRPTKRERRELEEFKGDYFTEDEVE